MTDSIDSKEKKKVMEILDSGWISEGARVKRFERELAKFVGVKHCIATSSGSAALISGLTALKYLKKPKFGEKVITSPLTYIADASAIVVSGFEPVFVDVDPQTFGITPENIKNHLEEAENSKDYVGFCFVRILDSL
jgi:dTDP-4-amino-4,6-dideoxygalactose transaminase